LIIRSHSWEPSAEGFPEVVVQNLHMTITNSGGDISTQATASLEVTPDPEPGTMLLLGAGMFALPSAVSVI
jgi:hypothetical protein